MFVTPLWTAKTTVSLEIRDARFQRSEVGDPSSNYTVRPKRRFRRYEGTSPAVTTSVSKVLKLTLDEKSENLVKSYIADGDEQKVEFTKQRKDKLTIVKKFSEEFRKFRQGKLINPVLKVVRTLPKEEMAAMAEALVELTALRRKVDSHLSRLEDQQMLR